MPLGSYGALFAVFMFCCLFAYLWLVFHLLHFADRSPPLSTMFKVLFLYQDVKAFGKWKLRLTNLLS